MPPRPARRDGHAVEACHSVSGNVDDVLGRACPFHGLHPGNGHNRVREEVPGQVLSDGKRGHVFHGTGLSEKGVEAGFCLLDDVCSVSCRVGDDATDVGGYRLRGLHFPIVIDGNVGRDGLFHLFKEGFRGKDVGSAYNDVHRALASRMLI